MGLNASRVPTSGGNSTPQEPMEAGTYPCRLVQVIDLGLQPQRPFQGQEKAPAHMIMTTYEFTDEFMKDDNGEDIHDKPRWLSEDFPLYNLSQDKATSTKRYRALDPSGDFGGDWTALVGTACNVTVIQNAGKGNHAGKIFSNIGAVASMRSKDAEKTPELVNPPKVFNLEDPDMEVFTSLPDWLQEKIKGNLEFKGSKLDLALSGEAAPQPTPSAQDSSEDTPW